MCSTPVIRNAFSGVNKAAADICCIVSYYTASTTMEKITLLYDAYNEP